MKGIRTKLLPSFLVVALSLGLAGCTETGQPAGVAGGTGIFDTWKTRYSANYDKSLRLRKMPPLHERGISTIAMIYQPYGTAGLQIVTAAPFGPYVTTHDAESAELVPDGFVEERFRVEAEAAPHVAVRALAPAELGLVDHLEDRGFYNKRVFDEAGKRALAALGQKGIDAILLVQEPRFVPGIKGFSTVPTPSKGLVYWRTKNVRAVAGFRFALFETATGEEMANTAFMQISVEPTGLRWRGHLESYTPSQRQEIAAKVQVRVANNVRVMLQLLKVIPGEDGKFLSFDPYEKEPGPEYPE